MTYEVDKAEEQELIKPLAGLPGTSGMVVFDSFCVMCSKAVRFLIRTDKKGRLWFTTPETSMGRILVNTPVMDKITGSNKPDAEFRASESIVFYKAGRIYRQSDAVVMILATLPYPWKALSCIRYIPRSVREWLYHFIARHRYRITGKRDNCPLPPPEVRKRFKLPQH